jgi:RNA polymerase sigma factor FliA
MSATAAVPARSREPKHLALVSQSEPFPSTLRGPPAVMHVCPPPQRSVELDDAQREKLLLEHLPQVGFIARRIHDRVPPQILLEDLVHAGILGLIDAVRKYDPNKNVQLGHYAEFRIRGAILDSLRQVDWSPRALRRHGRRLEQATLDCKARLGRDPGEPEIAAELNISLPKLQRLLADLRGLDIGSLQSDGPDSNGEENIQIPVSAEMDPYHRTLRAERTALLEKGIGELPERDRQILALYHFKEMTMKQIGDRLGIGESRVSQIHTAALVRLRTQLHSFLDLKSRSERGSAIASRPARRGEEAALWRRSF